MYYQVKINNAEFQFSNAVGTGWEGVCVHMRQILEKWFAEVRYRSLWAEVDVAQAVDQANDWYRLKPELPYSLTLPAVGNLPEQVIVISEHEDPAPGLEPHHLRLTLQVMNLTAPDGFQWCASIMGVASLNEERYGVAQEVRFYLAPDGSRLLSDPEIIAA